MKRESPLINIIIDPHPEELMPNPVNPSGPHEPQGPTKPETPHHSAGGFKVKPMTFLGMHFDADQSKKFWGIIIQSVNGQIQKDKDKALKALKKLGAEGDSDSDD